MIEIIDKFRSAMNAAGIGYSRHIVPDGRIHRIHINGDKPSSKNGAYALYLGSHPGGWFMDFKRRIKQNWSPGTGAYPEADIYKAKEFQRQCDAERAIAYEEAAKKAADYWEKSTQSDSTHPYLVNKKIRPCGIRQFGQLLIIPLYNENYEISSYQAINPKGKKQFMPGGKVGGCFYYISSGSKYCQTNTVLICEGFATGASLHNATGDSVFVAFNADNLLPVAQMVSRICKKKIIICGDNDDHEKGQQAAKQAANAIGAKVLIPDTPGFDWNDEINKGHP